MSDSFMSSHITPGKRAPFNWRVDGTQTWSEHFGEEKNLFPPPGIKP